MAFRPHRTGIPRAFASLLALGAALSACTTAGKHELVSSYGEGRGGSPQASLRKAAEAWGERYSRNKDDRTAALNYAAALSALGQHATAVAVLQQSIMRRPNDKGLAAAYGKALARSGRFEEAVRVLDQANDRERPDWRILSAQGAALDQLGRHDAAQRLYAAALQIAPDEPRVLSNLGLSQAFAGRLQEAEATLRGAAALPRADARVRQNLALVVGLQGRFADAEAIARRDLSAEDAAANTAYLRRMLAQPDKWKQLRGLDKAAGNAPATPKGSPG